MPGHHHLTIRKQLRYTSLFLSFVAAICTLAAAYLDNWFFAVGSGAFWLAAVGIDYYSLERHGIGETKAERAKEAAALAKVR